MYRIDCNKQTNQGFSIVELMVAMLIGLIIISAVMSIYVSTIKNSRDLLSSASLSQELTAVMSIVVKDIRRSGYWSGVTSTQHSQNNPFYVLQEITPETVPPGYRMPYAVQISSDQTCISLAYDADDDTGADVQKNDLFAFRLKNNSIQTLQRVKLSNFKKNACANNAGSWMNITDSGLISISDLHISTIDSQCFNINTSQQWNTTTKSHLFPCLSLNNRYSSGDRLVETRLINLTIKAHLTSDEQTKKQLSQKIRLRNNILVSIP